MGGLKLFKDRPWKPRDVECGPPFRRGSRRKSSAINFVLMNGGIGDFINFTSSLIWVAETQKHVDGFVWAHDPMLEVCRFLFKKYPNFRVHNRLDFEKYCVEGALIVAPQRSTQFLNATGQHLLDLGFNYFGQIDSPPEGWGYLPRIDYTGPWKWPELKQVKRYAIFTPGATTDVRTVPAYAFNELVDYVSGLEITPVFLGKKTIAGSYEAKFEEGYDYTKGIDLREQTTLLEATQIMRGAEFVMGLDNGLLHLAGCTNVPIIFGHNITTVKHRQIKRREGITIDITINEKDLECIGCQSRMRYTKHSFDKCIYTDKMCLTMMFQDKCVVWKQAINQILCKGL